MWQSGKFGCQYLIKHYEMLIFKTRSSFKVSKKKKISIKRNWPLETNWPLTDWLKFFEILFT